MEQIEKFLLVGRHVPSLWVTSDNQLQADFIYDEIGYWEKGFMGSVGKRILDQQ